MPGVIRILDDVTASRIAAGEVVERPASAVKELVENALDAGASRIVVTLEDGGKQRIEVSDDGHGMEPEDVVLAIQRHATSKIRSFEDLETVQTLGFRGEALPSIAAVSRMTIVTRPRTAATGSRLVVEHGEVVEYQEIGCPPGTTVTVAHLFENTPARLKFLKTTSTELARCIDVVGMLAAAHPESVFRLMHNGQEVFTTPGQGDLAGTLARLWGRDIARKLLAVRHEEEGVRVTGLVGAPDLSRPGRTHELFIVNGRPVRSRLLGHALEQAFRDVTPESRFPVACLHIATDPGQVDANVHPSKLEVKFRNEPLVHRAIVMSVREALQHSALLPELTNRRPFVRPSPVTGVGHMAAAVDTALEAFGQHPEDTGTSGVPPFHGEQAQPTGEENLAEMLRGFRVLGQANLTYIVTVTERGIVFVDQHVAHERVLYERLLAAREGSGVPSQRLAVPVTVPLGASEYALVTQRLGDFVAVGWELEPFGGTSLIVRAVPALLRSDAYQDVLRDMVDELVHQSVSRRLIVDRNQVTITNACHMAVRAGDELSLPEMEGLLHQLAETKNPHFCPHGRPAAILLTYAELDRRFKR